LEILKELSPGKNAFSLFLLGNETINIPVITNEIGQVSDTLISNNLPIIPSEPKFNRKKPTVLAYVLVYMRISLS